MRAKVKIIVARIARSRSTIRESAGGVPSSKRAPASSRAFVLPFSTSWMGVRTGAKALKGRTPPVTR